MKTRDSPARVVSLGRKDIEINLALAGRFINVGNIVSTYWADIRPDAWNAL